MIENTTKTPFPRLGAGRMAVELLLDAGADVNAVGDGGVTPLHERSSSGMLKPAKPSVRAARIAARQTRRVAHQPTYWPRTRTDSRMRNSLP
jgi:ankyrin repeat protein